MGTATQAAATWGDLPECLRQSIIGHLGVSGAVLPSMVDTAMRDSVARVRQLRHTHYQRGRRHEEAQSYARAVEAYRRAAELGSSYALCNLGYCHEHGLGVERDLTRALTLYSESAEDGNSDAQCNAGYLHEVGMGVARDLAAAARLYAAAAEQGNGRAQFNLGLCYLSGKGVERDEELAIAWLTRAAHQGRLKAQLTLACLYSHAGPNRSANPPRAVWWCRKAAEGGHAPIGATRLGIG